MTRLTKKLSPEEIITAIKQLTPEEYETLEILADKELTKELTRKSKNSYDLWKEGIFSTPNSLYIHGKLDIWAFFDDSNKRKDETWIERSKELEKKAINGDDKAVLELIKRDFRYLWWDYTIYKIFELQQKIEIDENKEEVERAKNCLEQIGKALVPIRKDPRSKIDKKDALGPYYKLREFFEETKKQFRRNKKLDWTKVHTEYCKIVSYCYPDKYYPPAKHKPPVEKNTLIAELTGGGQGKGNKPSEIALNCLAEELEVSTETLRTILWRRKDYPYPRHTPNLKRFNRVLRLIEEKIESTLVSGGN